ncbi:MAG: hypothetical protein JSS35_12540, partial [Proteobacteria bacterium]|nr:hypothetical protein [Pseudomonadota bacterium]
GDPIVALMLGARAPSPSVSGAPAGDVLAKLLTGASGSPAPVRGSGPASPVQARSGDPAAGRALAAAGQATGAPPRSRGQASPRFPAPDPQTLLLLLVQLDDLTLTDGMAAYGDAEDPLLPVGELSRLLELDVDVSPSDGRIEGRLGEARRALLIDLPAGLARIGPTQVSLAPGDVATDGAYIYVRTSLLSKLLPLKFAIDARALQMRLTATEPLPIQSRLQRLARLRQAPTSAATQALRVEAPYKLFTPPSFDVALGLGAQTLEPHAPTRYDIRLGGDLLYAGLQAYVGSDDFGRLTTTRVLLEKRSLDGDLLGPLHARVVGLGDVYTPGLAIGPRSLGGRGFEFSTAPLDQTSVFNRIDLRGELPLGDDVELYVNDVLQGAQSQAVNGQYEFLNVPLTQGINVIRIVTYGPRGQRSEETRIINASGGLLRPGQATFAFGVVDQNEPVFRTLEQDPFNLDRVTGKPRVVANASYGVTQYVTASLGGALYTDQLGVKRDLVTGGLRSSIRGFATELDFASDDRGGEGASIDVAGRIFGANTVLRHSEYRGGLLDENNAEADIARPLDRRTELDVDDNFRFGGRVVPISVRALRDSYADGGAAWIGQVRGSASLGSILYSAGLEYDAQTSPLGAGSDLVRGFLSLSTFRNYRWQVRTTLDYDIVPDARVSGLEVLIDRALTDRWSLRLGATDRLESPRDLELVIGSTTKTKFGDLALTGQYDTNQNIWRFGAQLNFGIGYNPKSGYELTRSGPGSGGSVAFHAFVDSNGDGRWNPGERGVAGVTLEGGELKAKTDADGRAYVSGFGAAPTARLLVGINEAENAGLKAPPAVIEFTPRPGGVAEIEYPLRPTGEVMVNIRLRRPGQPPVGLSATRVRLVDEKGQAVDGVTEFDGSVNFHDLPAATYRLELDKDQATRLRMRLTAPVTLTIKPDGSMTPDVDAEVEFEPRADTSQPPP